MIKEDSYNQTKYSKVKSNEKVVFEFINLFSIIVFILWYITPVFRAVMYGSVGNLIILGFISLWFLTSLIINPTWFMKMPKHLFIVSVMLLIFILISLLNVKGNPRSFLMIGVSFWFPLYVFYFYKTSHLKKNLKKLNIVILISIIITCLTTIYGFHFIPNAARFLSDSRTDFAQDLLLMRNNIGGFDFIYGIILLIPILLNITWQKKIIKLLAVLLIVWLVIKSNFTIAIILLLLSFILSLFSKFNKWLVLMLYVFCITLLLLLPADFYSSPILTIAHYINNPTISARLNDLGYGLQYGIESSGVHLSARLRLYEMSWMTFLQNPLTGVGPYYYVPNVGVGYHSQILDDLARYGLFGGVFILIFLRSYYKYLSAIWKKNSFNSCVGTLFIVFILSSLLNLTFSQPAISVIMFLLIPSIPIVFQDETKKINIKATREVR